MRAFFYVLLRIKKPYNFFYEKVQKQMNKFDFKSIYWAE